MKKRVMLILSCLFLSIGFIAAQSTSVSGTVFDGTGEPVIGASVVVKGTTTGTITDVDGKYTINVPAGKNVLVFSLIGMKTVEQKAEQGMRVVMEDAARELDEVVVTGYGTVTKGAYTGSISVVEPAVLREKASVSFEKALQGAVPGVTITSSSGQPGERQQISLRGLNTINGSTEPLYVIDGVPTVPENLSLSGVSGSPGTMGISSLIRNSDIESISILKDAAATSIYGSRGANGVIIITTKSGKSGKTRVTLKAQVGFNDWAIKSRELLSGDQYRELYKESYYNYIDDARGDTWTTQQKIDFTNTNVDTDAPIPAAGYVDWEDELFKKRGSVQNYEISINGGSESTKFFASLGSTDEVGKAKNSWIKQYAGRLNLTHDAGSLKIGANISITQLKKSRVAEGTAYANPYYAVRSYLTPFVPIYNADGSYYNGPLLGGHPNLVQTLTTDKYLLDITNARSSIWAQYNIFDNLSFKQTLSYDYINTRSTTVWGKNGGNGANANGLTIKLTPDSRRIYSSSILTYFNTIDKHSFDALVGWDADKRTEDLIQTAGSGFSSSLLSELAAASKPLEAYSTKDNDRLLSFLSRINYDYDRRYFASVSYRRDGSSRFGSNKRWGDFWSLSAAWALKSESFLQDVEFIDNLKLRTSLGETGNLPTRYYESQDTYSAYGSYAGNSTTYPARIPNPDLSWETTRSFDIGFEARFFDRVSFEFDFYNKNTKDLLSPTPVSFTTGFKSYWANIGNMRNRGFEFAIAVDVFKTEDFYWNSRLNFATNKNELTKMYGGNAQEITSPYIRKEGEAYYTFYMREFAGVNPDNGSEQWYKNTLLPDGSRDRALTENPTEAQRVVVGKGEPDLTGGWMNTFQYKGFELSTLFSFTLGGKFYDSGWPSSSNGYFDGVYLPTKKEYTDRWQNPGDNTTVGRRVAGYRYGNYTSSKWLHSQTHLRLKNISLSYSLPTNILQKIKLSDVRFVVSGSNLLTFKKNDDLDPEVPLNYQVGYNFPPLKDVTFGVEISF